MQTGQKLILPVVFHSDGNMEQGISLVLKARDARYLFGSDHTVTPNVDYDSYHVALDTYRKHMLY